MPSAPFCYIFYIYMSLYKKKKKLQDINSIFLYKKIFQRISKKKEDKTNKRKKKNNLVFIPSNIYIND